MVRLRSRTGTDTGADLTFRIVTPEPVGGLPVSAPTSESEGHRYRDGLILYKERMKCRDKPVVEQGSASENHRTQITKVNLRPAGAREAAIALLDRL